MSTTTKETPTGIGTDNHPICEPCPFRSIFGCDFKILIDLLSPRRIPKDCPRNYRRPVRNGEKKKENGHKKWRTTATYHPSHSKANRRYRERKKEEEKVE